MIIIIKEKVTWLKDVALPWLAFILSVVAVVLSCSANRSVNSFNRSILNNTDRPEIRISSLTHYPQKTTRFVAQGSELSGGLEFTDEMVTILDTTRSKMTKQIINGQEYVLINLIPSNEVGNLDNANLYLDFAEIKLANIGAPITKLEILSAFSILEKDENDYFKTLSEDQYNVTLFPITELSSSKETYTLRLAYAYNIKDNVSVKFDGIERFKNEFPDGIDFITERDKAHEFLNFIYSGYAIRCTGKSGKIYDQKVLLKFSSEILDVNYGWLEENDIDFPKYNPPDVSATNTV